MARIRSFVYPDIPPDLSHQLFRDDDSLIVIGVIGKSTGNTNKMAGLDMTKFVPLTSGDVKPVEGEIRFYFDSSETRAQTLYLHFQTTFDVPVIEQLLLEKIRQEELNIDAVRKSKGDGGSGGGGDDDDDNNNDDEDDEDGEEASFHSQLRTKFAQTLLFAVQICHIIVLVEPSNVFDTSYLNIFKALKVIREKYVLRFLPKLLKNCPNSNVIGREGRLCSPRFLFFFEKCLREYTDLGVLQKLEFEIEDRIYKMLRNEFVITNNSVNSLFSIPRNKRFVCINTNPGLRRDPITESVNRLALYIDKKKSVPGSNDAAPTDSDSDEEIRPYKGFAKPLNQYKANASLDWETKSNRLTSLIREHIDEALSTGFDDSIAKYKGKGHFVVPSSKSWYETFKLLHKIFIENPNSAIFVANDPEYKAYLSNFHRIVDIDDKFFSECCEYGLELAIENYNDMLPHHYSKDFHDQKIYHSQMILLKFGRGASVDFYVKKLKNECNRVWANGREQCECLSLRGNPCILAKHDDKEHSSGAAIISTCNCGRTQGHRQDPYTIRQANYEFYNLMADNCSTCNKLDKISFAIFEPSTNDFKAAEVHMVTKPDIDFVDKEEENRLEEKFQPLSLVTQSPGANLSLGSDLNFSDDVHDNDPNATEQIEEGDVDEDENSGSMNEIVIKVGEEVEELPEKGIIRQPSTTEYLSGMIHTLSPPGLLPQFPSWSLICIGASSIYSHNSGLPEHSQSGFLSGTNFLLPWDVQVRLENAASWAQSYDRNRNRRKPQPITTDTSDGQVFVLKIFVGYEYECLRGHRFMMNGPDKILRGGPGLVRDGGNKVVFSDMPLYFPCPCRNAKPSVGQLTRIHIVTPKAPVNIIVDPKVRTGGKNSHTFILGLPEPPKLTQSAYWILRLPYIYEGNDGPIMPPLQLTSSSSPLYGCLMAGMFGITEVKSR